MEAAIKTLCLDIPAHKSSACVNVYNPFDNTLIASVPSDDQRSVSAAVTRAETYDYSLTAWQRYSLLQNFCQLLLDQQREFATLIAEESGKTLKDATVEVQRAHQAFLLSSEEAKRITGEVVPLDAVANIDKGQAMVLREPVGLITAITPFNYPLNLVAHKVGPALAANNPIIVKPSEKTPLTALKMRDLLLKAGFPASMVQVVIGDPATIANQLIKDHRIRKVTFTGSVETGRLIMKSVGIKSVSMELGGNDPMIILADADLDQVMPMAIDGAFGNNGERCTSVKRFIVDDSIADKFAQKLVQAASKLVVGDQLHETTDIGPLIDTQAASDIEERIQQATDFGASLLCGGQRAGALLWPTVLDNVCRDNPIVQQETFGPVAPIMRVNGIEHAIHIANDTEFGLQSGVFTNNLASAKMAIEKIQAGAVMINKSPGFRAEHLPFGGIKNSGIGREGIRYAVESMTTLKTVVL